MILPVLDSLLPVLLMVALGTALLQFKFLPEPAFQALNKLAFWVGLPCMLFTEIAAVEAGTGTVLQITLTILAAAAGTVAFGWLVARLWRLPPATRRAFIQGGFRCNTAYVGLPVIYYAFRNNPEARAIAILALAPAIPIYNIGGVLLLVHSGSGGIKRRRGKALYEIARNPLIIACLLGLLALRYGWQPPGFMSRTLQGIGQLGLPAALLALGASLSFKRTGGLKRNALAASLIKVVVSPLLGYLAGRALGLTGNDLLVAAVYTATPTAVASYVMAEQMGADKELAAAIIVLSTLLAFPGLMLVLICLQ